MGRLTAALGMGGMPISESRSCNKGKLSDYTSFVPNDNVGSILYVARSLSRRCEVGSAVGIL